MRSDPETLETAIGHHFQDPAIFRRALTHRSRAFEGASPEQHNEQLEFLGDAILGFLISEALYRRFPDHPEGRLSKLKAHLASSAHLYETAHALGLGAYLELGRGEELTGGRDKRSLLVNALEALIAAMYLDSGIDAARDFVERFVLSGPMVEGGSSDSKGRLQELAQARGLPQPRYMVIGEKGPAHARVFTVQARVGLERTAEGRGTSKKSASQEAARALLQQITEDPEA